MTKKYYHKFRIYYEDTDFSGNVYHARYLHFFERARTEMLRSLGYDQGENGLSQEKLFFIAHNLEIKYLSPARMDNIILVETMLKEQKTYSITLFQKIYNFDIEKLSLNAKKNETDKFSDFLMKDSFFSSMDGKLPLNLLTRMEIKLAMLSNGSLAKIPVAMWEDYL